MTTTSTMILDSSYVTAWGGQNGARIVRASAAEAREIRSTLANGGSVLVVGCPDDRTGQIGTPSVRRVVDRCGMLVTRCL